MDAVRVTYQPRHAGLFSWERGEEMREHIETLIIALGDGWRHTEHRTAPREPRRRRPRIARSTYIPVRRDVVDARFAH
ncbi:MULTISPECIES: hypothetical protein [unclassified Microbacterium]|uniref:hypothetical protein n=1 Tax=unclassified Microbacterium TaxID=2609290 RepID=UPI0013D77588|nr:MULTISPECIES: hypothetical protein [unclassified Microbacterium]